MCQRRFNSIKIISENVPDLNSTIMKCKNSLNSLKTWMWWTYRDLGINSLASIWLGDSMSRLDSFLISEGFTNKLGRKCQSIDNRNISDHCPISIKSSKFNWGPKSFKIFMAWIEQPNFLPLVE